MEISCNVIKDILPLYAEDMTGDETKELIEGHLCSCKDCQNALLELKVKPEETSDMKMAGMKRVSDGIRKTKLWTVATAVLLVITILASLTAFLTFPVWATAEEAIKEVECLEDGRIKVYFTEQCAGIISRGAHENRGILCKKERWDGLFPRKLPEGMNDASYGNYMILGNTTIDGEVSQYAKDVNIWYVDYHTGIADTLLWDSGDAGEEIPMLEMSYSLLWIFTGVAAAFLLTALLGFLLRKKASGRFFQNRAAVFGSFCVSSLVVTSGQFMVYEELWMKLSIIGILMVLMSATVLCGLRLLRLKKQIDA
jgi:hypothetical protein